jgi:hypothetical protein
MRYEVIIIKLNKSLVGVRSRTKCMRTSLNTLSAGHVKCRQLKPQLRSSRGATCSVLAIAVCPNAGPPPQAQSLQSPASTRQPPRATAQRYHVHQTTHRRPSPLQPRVHDASWVPVYSVLAVASNNFAYAQLPLHVSEYVHPTLYATLQQVQAQRTALGLHGSPSAHLVLLHFQCGQLAGNLPLKLSQRCSKYTTVKCLPTYAEELQSCLSTGASTQQRLYKHISCPARALRRASSSAANPSVKASTYTSLKVGALATPSGAAAAEGSDSSASATLDFSSLWKCRVNQAKVCTAHLSLSSYGAGLRHCLVDSRCCAAPLALHREQAQSPEPFSSSLAAVTLPLLARLQAQLRFYTLAFSFVLLLGWACGLRLRVLPGW